MLIPRPETEHVVEAALALPQGARVVDVGTGSGAIALALADERPDLRDHRPPTSSADALAVARANAERLRPRRRVRRGRPAGRGLRPDRRGRLEPAVRGAPARRLAPEIARHEPAVALFAGQDGLEVYRRLVPAGAGVPFVAFEVRAWQAEAVSATAPTGFRSRSLRDLAGIERVVVGRR